MPMKWSLEGKLMTGGVMLILLLMGIVRLISYQNATALIENSKQIDQAKQVLSGLADMSVAITDAEAGRLAYLLFGKPADRQRYALATEEMGRLLQLSQELADDEMYQADLATLDALWQQRQALAQSVMAQDDVTFGAIALQSPRLAQLDQNRDDIFTTLARIELQATRFLQVQVDQSLSATRQHIWIEFWGTVFIFAVLLVFYGLLYRQLAKRRIAEAAQHKLTQEKEMSELKLRFFSMVSHEFRTPLSVILGSAQLLDEACQPWQTAKTAKNIDRIQSSARLLNQRLMDILTLARAEAGKLELCPSRVDLDAFGLNLVEDIQCATTLKRVIHFKSLGNSCHAWLDETLLHAIFSNLLSNALKYSSPDTSVELSLRCDSEAVIFQVSDRGIGIPLEQQTKLYEPFYRAQNVGHVPGAGLGLAVVKKCVELHGGEISLTSDIGSGTTVEVSIPHQHQLEKAPQVKID